MKQLTLVLSLLLTILLMGCTISDEELTKTTIDNTKQAFEDTPKDSNEQTKLFSYYLPEEFTIKETKMYNVLLEKGSKSYLLFVNENEEANSKVSYDTLVEKYEKPFISETFEDKERFGYLFVNTLEKNTYEVTVGIGGTKLTTEAKINDVSDAAKNMMDIVKSVHKK
ncbi:hypothetical protein [Metabacillus bambusae]|uniref:DUF4367 domain-containing protein n=1 Tax=Metabacillus bambusae TaxID=2795218 RepID=A0ABS3N4Q3_9BACI|nr:hypothetical protein [Metabacillus bambusae]MBO1513199.1 hypothetical protein [Metabacillus bambusae]